MIVNHSVLHILDFNSDICVFSQEELNIENTSVSSFVEKHLNHVQNDSSNQTGIFRKDSWFLGSMKQYVDSKIGFMDFSLQIANVLYDNVTNSDKKDSVDLLIVDFSQNDDSFLALLLMNSRLAYTHQVIKHGDTIQNSIIEHHAILPGITQKIDSYAIINQQAFSLGFSDKRRYIDGKDVFVLPEKILQCSAGASSRDVLKAVSSIAAKVAEEYGQNSTVVLSKAKNYLLENSEISTTLSPLELGEEIFAESEELQNAFASLVKEAQLPQKVEVGKSLAVKTGKSHKIKTDTGIEITFPAEYFENHEFIEFINNPNGTISIELKNIGKIINK